MLAHQHFSIKIHVYQNVQVSQSNQPENVQIMMNMLIVRNLIYFVDSRYIIKAFYDSSNTTETDLINYVGSIPTGTNDFKTTNHWTGSSVTVAFSYYKKKEF